VVNAARQIFVIDRSDRAIKVFDRDGDFLKTIGQLAIACPKDAFSLTPGPGKGVFSSAPGCGKGVFSLTPGFSQGMPETHFLRL